MALTFAFVKERTSNYISPKDTDIRYRARRRSSPQCCLTMILFPDFQVMISGFTMALRVHKLSESLYLKKKKYILMKLSCFQYKSKTGPEVWWSSEFCLWWSKVFQWWNHSFCLCTVESGDVLLLFLLSIHVQSLPEEPCSRYHGCSFPGQMSVAQRGS